MSGINGVGGNGPVYRITTAAPAKTSSASAARAGSADRLELSGLSHLVSLSNNQIRADKVAAIKAQIEAGTYETEARLDVAADRLLDDLAE